MERRDFVKQTVSGLAALAFLPDLDFQKLRGIDPIHELKKEIHTISENNDIRMKYSYFSNGKRIICDMSSEKIYDADLSIGQLEEIKEFLDVWAPKYKGWHISYNTEKKRA